MDFAETEEQSMIREMVRDFAEEVLAPTCLVRDRDQKPPLDEWKTFCEYGLQGITIPFFYVYKYFSFTITCDRKLYKSLYKSKEKMTNNVTTF